VSDFDMHIKLSGGAPYISLTRQIGKDSSSGCGCSTRSGIGRWREEEKLLDQGEEEDDD
jgi:hypothetical protein